MTVSAPTIIFITGLPASGKTTLARTLANEFAIPILAKDEFKELLFDTLGCKDRAWSTQLGAASFAIFYKTFEKMLMANTSFITDADFSRPDLARQTLQQLIHGKPHKVIEIRLVCDGNVLFQRFKTRSFSENRHSGHLDHLNFEEFQPVLVTGKRAPLELGGLMLEIDVTTFPIDNKLTKILKKELKQR